MAAKEAPGLLLVVSGPAGVGKGTVCAALRNEEAIALSVSVTTRSPRVGEEEGRHYYFRSREEFMKLVAEGAFLEWAEFCGNYYGTLRSEVERELADGETVLLEIEIQGAAQVKQCFPEGVFVFIVPPSLRVLEERLRGRGTEEENALKGRLRRAEEELAHTEDYDYVVINDQVTEAVDRLREIIAKEREKRGSIQ